MKHDTIDYQDSLNLYISAVDFWEFLNHAPCLVFLSSRAACRAENLEAQSHWISFIFITGNLCQFCSAGVYISTSCLITNERIHRHSLNLLPVATPGPRVVSHPYSIPLNWGRWHMVGTRATSPPPLYERYKFRIGFNTSIPHWPTRLTQLLCWICHTHTHSFWCNPIRTCSCRCVWMCVQERVY